MRRVWCSREDAEPDAQYVGTVDETRGLMRYLALHFLKESQRPPRGWSGQRVTYSRGYYTDGVECTRTDAQRSLRIKRRIHGGVEPMRAALEVELAEAETWELIAVRHRVHLDKNTGELRALNVFGPLDPIERGPCALDPQGPTVLKIAANTTCPGDACDVPGPAQEDRPPTTRQSLCRSMSSTSQSRITS